MDPRKVFFPAGCSHANHNAIHNKTSRFEVGFEGYRNRNAHWKDGWEVVEAAFREGTLPLEADVPKITEWPEPPIG